MLAFLMPAKLEHRLPNFFKVICRRLAGIPSAKIDHRFILRWQRPGKCLHRAGVAQNNLVRLMDRVGGAK